MAQCITECISKKECPLKKGKKNQVKIKASQNVSEKENLCQVLPSF